MKDRRAPIAAGLALLCALAYSGVLRNGFVNYDDDVYVTANPHVLAGVTGDGLRWAATSFAAANWHPVTWVSHMVDVEASGLAAGRHHAASLLIHALDAILLFLLLARMTGATFRPALVAALFAVHPLHVESVAWAAERKDVLSTLFWLLTTWAWVRYTEGATRARYAAVLGLYALGLMSKPMLVTLPLTLMLLDVWPLRRAERPTLLKEKLPLFAMAAASGIVTVIAQQRGGAVQSLAGLSLPVRAANALAAYGWYLGKMAWPASLACLYPHPGRFEAVPTLLGAAVVVGLSALALRSSKGAPYVLFGWAWYVVTLLPVIGLLQVGAQSVADRYSYVPLIGIFIALAWGLAAIVEARPTVRPAAVALAVLAVVALVPVTRAQVQVWRNNTSLFAQALRVTKRNALAHNNFGLELFGQGRTEEAISHYKEALAIKPDYLEALNNLGSALHSLGRDAEAAESLRRALAVTPDSPSALVNMGNAQAGTGHPDEARASYERAIRIAPDFLDAHKNLGLLLDRMGIPDEAIAELEHALRLAPNDVDSHVGLATALSDAGRFAEAEPHFERALAGKPGYPEAYNAWGIALAAQGRTDEAIARYGQALAARPRYAEAENNLGLALASTNRLQEAVPRFEAALAISPGWPQAHNNLGVTLARLGRLPEAVVHFREAVRLDPGFEQARTNLERVEGARH